VSGIDTLAAAVRATCDRDEHLARELSAWADGTGRADSGGYDFARLMGEPAVGPFGGQSPVRNWSTGQDIAKLADPVRVLREVAALRALVDALLAEPHAPVEEGRRYYPCQVDADPPGLCDCGRDARVTAYLQWLAWPYSTEI
jgi:hypothetical protein